MSTIQNLDDDFGDTMMQVIFVKNTHCTGADDMHVKSHYIMQKSNEIMQKSNKITAYSSMYLAINSCI
jgi:hypothetical protein